MKRNSDLCRKCFHEREDHEPSEYEEDGGACTCYGRDPDAEPDNDPSCDCISFVEPEGR